MQKDAIKNTFPDRLKIIENLIRLIRILYPGKGGLMTDFKVLVLDKLASSFEGEELKEAEEITNLLFEKIYSGGQVAVESLMLARIKQIVKESGMNLSDIEQQLGD